MPKRPTTSPHYFTGLFHRLAADVMESGLISSKHPLLHKGHKDFNISPSTPLEIAAVVTADILQGITPRQTETHRNNPK